MQLFAVLAAALLTAACLAAAQPEAPAAQPDPGLADLIRLADTNERDISRFHNQRWSLERIDRLDAYHRGFLLDLAESDFASLSPHAKLDHLLLAAASENALARLELDRRWLAEMDAALPFREAIQNLELARRRMENADPRAAAETLAAIPDQVKKAREAIEHARKKSKAKPAPDTKPDAKPDASEGDTPAENPANTADTPADSTDASDDLPLSPTVALRAAVAIDGLKRTLNTWAESNESFKPDFAWWTRQPREAAQKSLDEYADFLRKTVAGVKGEPEDPLIGDPIGESALNADLRAEFIAYSPRELIAIGEREFAWCESEMKKAAAEMRLGDGPDAWKTALAQVKADFVPPGEQDAYVRDTAREAVQWLKDRDLLTIPELCEELWRLEMLDERDQRTMPFAVYTGQAMGVAYPTGVMGHEDKLMSMRGNNRHFTRIVTPHELIPGHHLQGFMAARERPERRTFSTPFFVEGWALYWEMELYDRGWPRTPQERIGMLFWRMHRAARIIVSLKFHLGEMSPPQMVDFLVDRVGHERLGATSEVRRFIGGDYSPLYQCGYMIGGLQIRALKDEVVAEGTNPVPGKLTIKQFHDALLTYGSIPVELVRAGVSGATGALTRDSRGAWKFAEQP